MILEKLIVKTLLEEVVPAMGCTEPVAIALAVCKARELTQKVNIDESSVVNIEVFVSPNIYKNGLSVGIPGTQEVGLIMAIALGYTRCNSIDSLEVFKNISSNDIAFAKQLINQGKIILKIADTDDKIFVEATVNTKTGFGKSIIKNRHSHFVHFETENGIEMAISDNLDSSSAKNLLFDEPIMNIINTIIDMPVEPLAFLLDGLTMNEKIAHAGLDNKYGLGVGYTLNDQIKKGILGSDLMNRAMTLTAAASDARMAGISMPVMSSNGSGNNGLTALLPIVAYAEMHTVSDEQLARAIAMSHMVNSVIKNTIGRLSALCGCGVAAGTGASVALAWMMGADDHQLDGVIQNMIANTTGMICDGAKVGCSLKLSTSASAAVQSALLATNDIIVPAFNGIIGKSADDTIFNLGVLSREAMNTVDHTILRIMNSSDC